MIMPILCVERLVVQCHTCYPTFFHYPIHLWPCSDWKRHRLSLAKCHWRRSIRTLHSTATAVCRCDQYGTDGQFNHDCIREAQTTDGSIHYLTLTGNYGLTDSHFFEILKGKQLFGISAGYGMDSMFGPLEITFGYSNQTDKGSCYVNLGYYF